ncbi:MAG TPA: lactate racemase domain-containing protein [Bacteroidota bacterium]|nr:lactate racemase domain-containing protein [Bacteroidota bacterium]
MLIGKGSYERALERHEIEEICTRALEALPVDGKRVLVLIPDHTRHAPVALFFEIIAQQLHSRVRALDFLVATGTHAAMPPDRLYAHVGLTPEAHARDYPRVAFFNHDHRDRGALTRLGTIPSAEIASITGGLSAGDIPVTINSMAVEHDQILIVSPVVPHEAMGFAGGNKYFFPGIAGLEVVETFHWLAALITNPVVNGVKDTPTRRVIDRAAEMLRTPALCFAFALNAGHRLACLFAGDPKEAWSNAADYSGRLHIARCDRPYSRILGLVPPIYEDIWVAGKAMYKLEPVLADGGELVIYGPHIREFSFMHGREIERIGYHVRDYFTGQWERFAREPKLILAHSTNVRGTGTFEKGREYPRAAVTLATAIPARACAGVNLGYRDPASIDLDEWRADPGTLVVEEAGQVLYRLEEAVPHNA